MKKNQTRHDSYQTKTLTAPLVALGSCIYPKHTTQKATSKLSETSKSESNVFDDPVRGFEISKFSDTSIGKVSDVMIFNIRRRRQEWTPIFCFFPLFSWRQQIHPAFMQTYICINLFTSFPGSCVYSDIISVPILWQKERFSFFSTIPQPSINTLPVTYRPTAHSRYQNHASSQKSDQRCFVLLVMSKTFAKWFSANK